LALAAAGCTDSSPADLGGDGGGPDNSQFAGCNLDLNFIRDGGVGRDGIPALTDPDFITANPDPDNAYVSPGDRVVGIILDGQPLAIPHNVLWWHEIVNLNRGGEQLAITYCPLTGSSLVFDRASVDGDEFGVSGLLWQNNLIMYNRRTGESLWPQMLAQARCGPASGQVLAQYPAVEMTWAGWKTTHPNTLVVSSAGGLGRDWTTYPYGNYESLSNNGFLFRDAMPPLDRRRPAKERVIGIPDLGDGGIALPFGALTDQGPSAVVEVQVDGIPLVVFWDSRLEGGAVFRPVANGQALTFFARNGAILDEETGTAWDIHGRAYDGALEGGELEQVEEAYVAFWGAWAAFHPETDLWVGNSP
jgi:hypothetical protein